jgi:TP901 family phage tail tape measure protein
MPRRGSCAGSAARSARSSGGLEGLPEHQREHRASRDRRLPARPRRLGVAAVKTAMDFQDAFAGVRKTIEGTPAELDALNKQLRALATRIPVKYEDIASIAAEAGALGVPTKAIAKFTEVVARLSASTVGLTVEAAAEAFGKFRNVLSLADDDLDNAGSALIALGNAGASSEGDIIEVAKRFAAAGAQARLSAAEVLGWSSAIASMGVEPEAAGSSLSRLFNNITKYLGTGNAKIQAFTKTTGLSVAAFKKLFTNDAGGAVELFLQKLSGLDRFKASAVLKKAGITNVRDINAVLLLSQHYDELHRQVALSNQAFKEGADLQRVSEARFASNAQQMEVLKNNVREAAAEIGEALLPEVTELTKEAIAWLQSHPEDIHNIAKELAGDFKAAVTWAKSLDWNAIRLALGAGAGFAKDLVGAFMAMPPWVQQLLTVGFVANKFTGGALSDVIGALGKGVIKGVLGMNAGVVNIKAGVVNGAGGVGGGAGGKGGGLAGKLGTGLAVATAAVSVAEAVQTYFTVNQATSDQATGVKQTLEANIAGGASLADLNNSLAAIDTGIAQIRGNPLFVLVQGDALTKLDQMRQETVAAIGRQTGEINNADRWWSETAANTTRTSDSVEKSRQQQVAKQDELIRKNEQVRSAVEANRIALQAKQFVAKVTVPVTLNQHIDGQKTRTTFKVYNGGSGGNIEL